MRDHDKVTKRKYRKEIATHETGKYDQVEHSAEDTLNRVTNGLYLGLKFSARTAGRRQ
ncbi:hypothetical protein ARMGADRAFT_1019000 [Armillaria gallica]|uniref:Uncharacterized protein n=1 Tax=Armillaria gallica TaxID=47427 RepID=A0A2H3CK16_ARMGA|nr:hypothetical protein ARMGADRAFT_1019000 [Armillaria gallica]